MRARAGIGIGCLGWLLAMSGAMPGMTSAAVSGATMSLTTSAVTPDTTLSAKASMVGDAAAAATTETAIAAGARVDAPRVDAPRRDAARTDGAATSGQAPAAADTKPASSLDSLAWLTGAWTGTMGKATIEEHWIPAAGKTMFGVSRTVVGDRTVMFEFLRLEQRPDGIVYVAQPNGRTPTEFRLIASGPSFATFENPQHDMPKIIRYAKDGEATLVAEIEGDEKGKPVKQRFTFSRVAPRP